MSFETLPYDIYYNITGFIARHPHKINATYQLKKEYKALEPMLYLNKDIYNYYTVYSKYINSFKERQQFLKVKEYYYKVLEHFKKAVDDSEYAANKQSVMYITYKCQECRTIVTPKREPTADDVRCENENLCYACAEDIFSCSTCGIHITDRIRRLADTERTYVCSYDCHYTYKYCLDRYDEVDENGDEIDGGESNRFKRHVARGCYNASYKQYYIDNPL